MTATGRCPYCRRPGTGEPCTPACAAVRSTTAHDRKQHPLDQAHSPTATPTGALIYCVCGWQGCPQRLTVDAAVWQAEVARRAGLSPGVQVWHARGDRLVPLDDPCPGQAVAPNADGRIPTPGGRRP